jgi:hypothetical protein
MARCENTLTLTRHLATIDIDYHTTDASKSHVFCLVAQKDKLKKWRRTLE